MLHHLVVQAPPLFIPLLNSLKSLFAQLISQGLRPWQRFVSPDPHSLFQEDCEVPGKSCPKGLAPRKQHLRNIEGVNSDLQSHSLDAVRRNPLFKRHPLMCDITPIRHSQKCQNKRSHKIVRPTCACSSLKRSINNSAAAALCPGSDLHNALMVLRAVWFTVSDSLLVAFSIATSRYLSLPLSTCMGRHANNCDQPELGNSS